MRLKYAIDFPGEMAAGFHPFHDEVTVELQDAGGEPGEFEEEMRVFLSEWFDGASVTLAVSA